MLYAPLSRKHGNTLTMHGTWKSFFSFCLCPKDRNLGNNILVSTSFGIKHKKKLLIEYGIRNRQLQIKLFRTLYYFNNRSTRALANCSNLSIGIALGIAL